MIINNREGKKAIVFDDITAGTDVDRGIRAYTLDTFLGKLTKRAGLIKDFLIMIGYLKVITIDTTPFIVNRRSWDKWVIATQIIDSSISFKDTADKIVAKLKIKCPLILNQSCASEPRLNTPQKKKKQTLHSSFFITSSLK